MATPEYNWLGSDIQPYWRSGKAFRCHSAYTTFVAAFRHQGVSFDGNEFIDSEILRCNEATKLPGCPCSPCVAANIVKIFQKFVRESFGAEMVIFFRTGPWDVLRKASKFPNLSVSRWGFELNNNITKFINQISTANAIDTTIVMTTTHTCPIAMDKFRRNHKVSLQYLGKLHNIVMSRVANHFNLTIWSEEILLSIWNRVSVDQICRDIFHYEKEFNRLYATLIVEFLHSKQEVLSQIAPLDEGEGKFDIRMPCSPTVRSYRTWPLSSYEEKFLALHGYWCINESKRTKRLQHKKKAPAQKWGF